MKDRHGFSAANIGIAVVLVVSLAVAAVVVGTIGPTGETGGAVPKAFTYDLSELRKIDPKLIAYRQEVAFGTGLSDSRGVAVDGVGRIYVAGSVVRVFDGAGRQLRDIDTPGPARCVTVAGRRIYVGLKDHVEVYDLDGNHVASWPISSALLASSLLVKSPSPSAMSLSVTGPAPS